MEEWNRKNDIKKIYTDWKSSGLTQAEYCKQKGIPFTWFKNQSYKKREQDQVVSDTTVSGKFNAVSFNEAINTSEQAPYCEITFSGKHTVSFSDKASLLGLKSLISDLIQL